MNNKKLKSIFLSLALITLCANSGGIMKPNFLVNFHTSLKLKKKIKDLFRETCQIQKNIEKKLNSANNSETKTLIDSLEYAQEQIEGKTFKAAQSLRKDLEKGSDNPDYLVIAESMEKLAHITNKHLKAFLSAIEKNKTKVGSMMKKYLPLVKSKMKATPEMITTILSECGTSFKKPLETLRADIPAIISLLATLRNTVKKSFPKYAKKLKITYDIEKGLLILS